MTIAAARAPRSRLPRSWPVLLAFGGFAVWWILGMAAFIWPLLAVPLVLRLVWLRRSISVPRGFGIYLLFLLWVVGSATQVQDVNDLIILGYRFSLYLSAGALFLTVYNEPSWRLTDRHILISMVLLWGTVVVGGFLGMLFPQVSITSPAELLLPGPLLSNQWLQDLTHVRFAQVQEFLGYSVARPSAPFTYTNEWGSALALLTPFVIAFVAARETPRWPKPVVFSMLLASVVPAVFSVNRGLWLSLGVAVAYATFRLMHRGRGGVVLLVIGVVALAGVLVWFTDLRTLVVDRLATPHSNEGRFRLYEEALQAASRSPFFGYGVPQAAAESGPRVGTHGFIWLLMVSHGIPAALMFTGWLLFSLWRTAGAPTRTPAFWMNVVVLVACVQLPYYELLPAQIQITMVAAAVAWRARSDRRLERIARARDRPRPAVLASGR